MAVLTDEEVGVKSSILSDADVGIKLLSDADVGLEQVVPRSVNERPVTMAPMTLAEKGELAERLLEPKVTQPTISDVDFLPKYITAPEPLPKKPETLGEAVKSMSEPIYPIPRVEGDDPRFIAVATGVLKRPPTPTEAAVLAGTINTAKGFVEFVESPIGIGTMGIGGLVNALKSTGQTVAAEILKRITATGFAAEIGRHVPEAAKAAGEASVSGTTQEKTEAYLNLGASVALPGALAHSALAPKTSVALGEAVKGAEVVKPFREVTEPEAVIEQPRKTDVPATEAVLEKVLPIKESVAEAPEVMGGRIQEPTPVGPGAASPVEFQQRLRTLEEPPADRTPTVTVDAAQAPSPEIVRKNKDYNLFNRINSSQAVFYFGKLGEAAKSAWEKMALGEFSMRESIGRDTQRYITDLLGKLPRPLRKQGGKAFFDVLNGRKMEEIEAEWSAKPGGDRVVNAAREVKTRLEEIRTTIRDIKRERYESYLNGLDKASIEELFRDNINKDVPSGTKAELSSALARDQFPDDWGIADGSYLPHLFFGNWKVTAKLPGAEESSFVTRSKTPQEAKVRIRQLVKNNPEMKDAQFTVEQDVSIPPDMVRLFDKRFFALVQQMKEKLEISPSEIREAQSGIIGKKSSKQKWFGSLQERKGATGYEKDFQRVMSAYLSGFHRWRVLSEVNRETIPLIEQARAEGRVNAANRLEGILDNLWGKPAKSSLEFDALIREIPGLRDWVEPMALDRWARFVRQAAAVGHLTTARFALVNRLQPLQGLYPILGERIVAQAKLLQHSAEGRRLLDEFGVTFDVGQYGELGAGSKLARLRERLSGERRNLEISFLAMFIHGREQGMTPQAAANYAKLRGQLMTQFTPLVSDVPQAFEGPIGQTVFQYKRFTVKQLELIGRMAKEGDLTGLSRMAAVLALTGGLSYYMRQLYLPGDTRHKAKQTLEEEFGEDGAQAILYGLPGLVGADLSGSFILGDRPIGNIYEKIGRTATGPAVSTAIELGRVIGTEEREPMSASEKALVAAKRIPALKPLTELIDLERRNVDVLTPDGETAYRRTIKDVIVSIGSFRSANESNIKTAVDAVIQLKKESAELKNRYYVEWQKTDGNLDSVMSDIDKFNQRWPEAAITQAELAEYTKMRSKGSLKTDVERIGGKKFRSFVE